ncbi:MAG: flagellar basal body-associated FliL family protein [Fimbriimonadaceae bacterium]|nr:flagellar basal body-associated FliL family protein [Fimbriimonadaceae bacterium]
MAEAKEGAPKKKNMLPVIIAVVAVIAGGGFFMMNGGKKAEDEESHHALKLSEHTEEIGEFLVNLKDGAYLSTRIAVQCEGHSSVSSAGDGHGKGGEPYPFVKDAIISVLTGKTLDEITTVEGKSQLRREIAYSINHAYNLYAPPKDGERKRKPKKSELKHDSVPEELMPDYEPEYPEWDNDEGPVLKVFFLTFTTQR